MPKFNLIKTSFLAGEVSPKLDARTDLTIYQASCRRLVNFILHKQGGIARRPGTRNYPMFLGDAPASGRLVPFVSSTTTGFPLLFTSSGKLLACEVTDSGAGATSVVSPFTGNRPYELQYAQSADTMWVVHPDVRPHKVIGPGSAGAAGVFMESFTASIAPSRVVDAFPYRDRNSNESLLLGYVGTTTVGSTGVLNATGFTFHPLHIGAIFKLEDPTSLKVGAVQVTGYNSPTQLAVKVINKLFIASGATTHGWWESAWSDFRGWPRTVAFYKGRLLYGGNKSEPDTIWSSYAGGYSIMNQATFGQPGASEGVADTLTASAANRFHLSSQQLNTIQWMCPGKTLVVGTHGQEYVVNSVHNPETGLPDYNVETSHGSQHVMPQRAGYSVMFSQRTGRAIREMYFNFDSQTYTSDELTVLADHMPGEESGLPAQVRTMAWHESESILWVTDTAGGFYGCTRDKNLGITGWHRHRLGGSYFDPINGLYTSPVVNSVCVVPSASTKYDEVFLSVTRTINGAPYHTVEVMRGDFRLDALDSPMVDGLDMAAGAGTMIAENAPVWVDMASTLAHATPITKLTGVYTPDWNGVTLAGLADGRHFTAGVDHLGNVELPFPTDKLTIGLAYQSQLQTQRIDGGGAATGTAQGAIKRIDRVVFRFLRTASAKVGRSFSALRALNFRPPNIPINQAIPLFTGEVVESWDAGSDRDGYVCVEVDDALPCSLLAVTARGEVNE